MARCSSPAFGDRSVRDVRLRAEEGLHPSRLRPLCLWRAQGQGRLLLAGHDRSRPPGQLRHRPVPRAPALGARLDRCHPCGRGSRRGRAASSRRPRPNSRRTCPRTSSPSSGTEAFEAGARQRADAVNGARARVAELQRQQPAVPLTTAVVDEWPSLTVEERHSLLSAAIQAVLVSPASGRGSRRPVGDRVSVVWVGDDLPDLAGLR